MKRRNVALLVVFSLSAALLAGCGNSGMTSQKAQTGTYEVSKAAEEKPEAAAKESAKKEEPVSSAETSAPASETPAPAPETSAVPEAPAPAPETPAEPEAPAPAPEASEPEKPAETNDNGVSETTIRPEIKEAIDSYEAYIDQYCEFMKKADYSDLAWVAEYAKYMTKLTDMEKKFNSIQDKDMTIAEQNYYIEVLNRCNTKMMQVATTM